ncbi:MAG TPA: phosphoribosylformylglycinamidine synthase subunit PurS [Nocardioidaceae bacterium]|nr:phosphoribosylformylglycinamidine synthase subunit PurS [Nocardioidaceae bacterium]
MARVVVDVMLKAEILDPQGKAVHGALQRLGVPGVADVRQGKRFEIEIEGDLTDDRMSQVHSVAESLLSNPVIEDYRVHVESEPVAAERVEP